MLNSLCHASTEMSIIVAGKDIKGNRHNYFFKQETWSFICTYSNRAAEKSGLLKLIPALYLVNKEDAVSNPISPPKLRSLLPIVADSSKRGVGFRPMLESMAAWGWRYCTSSCNHIKKQIQDFYQKAWIWH